MTTSTFPRSSSNAPLLSVAWTGRSDGDFHPIRVPSAQLAKRQRRIVERPWTMLDQYHGNSVVRVDAPGDRNGDRADGAITDSSDLALAVWVGDCAPVVLIGADREFAVVHAGWRGLSLGVIDSAVAAFSEPVERAVLGPVICGECYEFGETDLETVALAVGVDAATISSTTRAGTVGLDMGRAVASSLASHHIPVVVVGDCPGCGADGGFSHRVRSERQRHAVVAWQEDRAETAAGSAVR